MRNAIVTAADSKYLPAACCALISCVRDGEANTYTSLFLLACDVSAEDAEKARIFLESLGASVEIVVIGADCFRPFRISGYVSAATYARLLLPQFFDNRWDRLLYLDADVRVMAPLRPLLDTSLGGRPFGAVHDYLKYEIYGMEESRKRLALRSDAPYFNAGVICFDWSATNASGLLQQARAFAEKSSHLCKSHDQDALNKAFEGAWAPLDPRWNFMTVAVPDDIFRLYYPERLQPYIAHFAGAMKPWTKGFPERFGRHRAWYCDLLRESPWPHFAAPAHASLTLFRSSTDRLKRWVSAKRKRFQAAFGHVSRAKDTVGQQRPSAVPRKSSLTEASRNGEANPELELLLDQMIAEAAGSERATRPGSK